MGERRRDIDALRGLAIVLVVLGHSLESAPATSIAQPISQFIYTFHIPLFAFVSGFVLWNPTRGGAWVWLSRRFQGLMVPYAAWFLVATLVFWGFAQRPSLAVLPAALVSADIPGALWFLYALFMCCVLLTPFRSSPALLLASAIVVGLVPHIGGIPPWTGQLTTLDVGHIGSVGGGWFAWRDVLWLYPFVALGAAAAAGFDALRARAIAIVGVCAIATPLLLVAVWPIGSMGPWLHELLGSSIVPGAADYLLVVVRYLLALSEIVLAYTLVEAMGERSQRWLAVFGVNTLGIYALHQFFLPWHIFHAPWSQLMTFAFAFVCSLAMTLGLAEIPLARRILLGKRDSGFALIPSTASSANGSPG